MNICLEDAMDNLYLKRNILCIDLKSFFASVECIERGKDPFKYPLVVANKMQGDGAITLAVTPYLKMQGVKSRGRLFEIPKNIKYFIARPRMSLYTEKSKEIVSIYLDYVSKEDILIYSIDECFLDVTNYLKLYHKSDIELAKDILNTIYKKTHLTATCGIGPNMLLAKISMDIESKHNKDNIAKWTYDDIKEKFYPITPLSKFWGIGPRMEKRLNALGLYKIGDIANYDKNKLINKFGIMGEEIYNHSRGIDLARISDFNTSPKDKSYGQSEVLYKDYYEENIDLIISNICDNLAARLRKHNKLAGTVSFGIRYSKSYGGGFYHSRKLIAATDDPKLIHEVCLSIFSKFYEYYPIRGVSISLGGLVNNKSRQLNLFEEYKDVKAKSNINHAVDDIKSKYGRNSIIKASHLLKDSTAIERNKKIGGHHE